MEIRALHPTGRWVKHPAERPELSWPCPSLSVHCKWLTFQFVLVFGWFIAGLVSNCTEVCAGATSDCSSHLGQSKIINVPLVLQTVLAMSSFYFRRLPAHSCPALHSWGEGLNSHLFFHSSSKQLSLDLVPEVQHFHLLHILLEDKWSYWKKMPCAKCLKNQFISKSSTNWFEHGGCIY